MIGAVINITKVARPLVFKSFKCETGNVAKLGAFATLSSQKYKTKDAERIFE